MPQNQRQMLSHAEIEAKCVAIIDAHAHRDVLREADIRSWVKDVVGTHGELALWHAARAGGFGGSEIGVLVRNHQGHRADHQNSAHDIVEGKLLRRVPDGETGHLRRGHENEPRHAQWFYDKYRAVRDDAAFEGLSHAIGVRPWMRYSPDELALIPIGEPNPHLGGRTFARWLIDYKAPSQVEEAEEVAFQYACQLHQGALVCAQAGIHLDGLMLSQFSWAGWTLKDDHIPYDPELSRQILRAGDFYWDHVMRADVPRYVNRPRFDRENEVRKEWEERGIRIAQLTAMSKALQVQLDVEASELKEHLARYRMAGTKMTLGELSVNVIAKVDHDKVTQSLPEKDFEAAAQALLKKGASASYDEDAMARHLRGMGVNLKQFAKSRYDDAKVYDYALETGLDADAFIKEEIRLAPSAGLIEQARETVRAMFGASPKPSLAQLSSEGQQDDRAGRNTERSAPRSVSA